MLVKTPPDGRFPSGRLLLSPATTVAAPFSKPLVLWGLSLSVCRRETPTAPIRPSEVRNTDLTGPLRLNGRPPATTTSTNSPSGKNASRTWWVDSR